VLLPRQCQEGKKNFLVSTDILAKGIDIDRCNVVVNYDLPIKHEQGVGITSSRSTPDFEKHLHRVGRAGRANKKGVAFHLVNEREPYVCPTLFANAGNGGDREHFCAARLCRHLALVVAQSHWKVFSIVSSARVCATAFTSVDSRDELWFVATFVICSWVRIILT